MIVNLRECMIQLFKDDVDLLEIYIYLFKYNT